MTDKEQVDCDEEIVPGVFVEIVTETFCDTVTVSTIRPATKDDIQAAAELHSQGKCSHNVVTGNHFGGCRSCCSISTVTFGSQV